MLYYCQLNKFNRKGGYKMFNYSKLRGRIREKYDTQSNFAQKMGISTVSVSCKLGNKAQWTQEEILKAAQLLEISNEEIPTYFFTERVKDA